MKTRLLITISVLVISIIIIGITQMGFDDPQTNWSNSYSFSGVPLENYQKWCEGSKGVWYDEDSCGFVDNKDALRAEAILDDLRTQMITGEYAEAICEILSITCPENVEFKGSLNWDTNSVSYSYVSKKLDYQFKIQDKQLEFKGERLVDGTWQTTGNEWQVWSSWSFIEEDYEDAVPHDLLINKDVILLGDTITVFGNISNPAAEYIIIRIFNENNGEMENSRMTLDDAGFYKYEIKIQSSWPVGSYSVTVMPSEFDSVVYFDVVGTEDTWEEINKSIQNFP